MRRAREAARRYWQQQYAQEQAQQQAKPRPWWQGGIYDRINEWDRTRTPIDPLRVVGKILGFGSLGFLGLCLVLCMLSPRNSISGINPAPLRPEILHPTPAPQIVKSDLSAEAAEITAQASKLLNSNFGIPVTGQADPNGPIPVTGK
jgi:hypothetical protein